MFIAESGATRYRRNMANARISGRIILAGGSGFLGRSLAQHFAPTADEIVILTRGPNASHGNIRYVNWDAQTLGDWSREIDGAAAVVNMVGKSVDCRKTPAAKKVILESRVNSVNVLARAIAQAKNPPLVWVQYATAHILGDTQDEILDESSPIGTGFAPLVGLAWEKALNDAAVGDCRKVILRISFVLGRGGGALAKLAMLARCFLGGTVGSGRQYISWIHEDDLNVLVERAIADQSMSGVYIATAPNPATNREFMRELRAAVHRPWSPPAPAILVRFGSWLLRTDPELALLGRRCVPTRLLAEGFSFKYIDVARAIRESLV